MDKDTLGLAILTGGAVTATVGGLIRYGLLPYLREQLQLNREIHQQVTSAPSAPAEPSTMREELAEVRERVDRHAGELDDAVLALEAMALMFDGHLDWSQDEVDALWAELGRQREAGLRPDYRHTHKHRKDAE